ncbi:MAG: PIG-L family deacetylase [Chloroflexi bacterium]|nr:PIG-L family deacetylase [Chloroflexota bacterium]
MSHALPPAFTDILVVQAHPDDAEHGMAGTVARWTREGRRVHYLLCTSGDKGSADPHARPSDVARQREAEQREAGRRLGLASVQFLGRPDGELEVSLAFRAEVTAVIRAVRPQLVATFDPWRPYQLHPDHRAVGQVTLDAVIAARDPLYYPEQRRDGLEAYRVREVWLWSTDQPDVWIDITDTLELKLHALQAHVSQLGDWTARAERIRERARAVGSRYGVAYAEEFKRLVLLG